MVARFYEGASIKSTRSITQEGKVPPPQKNTMKGLPGFIRTKMDKSSGGLASAKPVGPRFNMGTSLETTKRTVALRSQGAYIGSRAKPGDEHYTGKYADNGKFRGSSDVSYRATSTGAPGRIVGNKGTPQARGASEKEGAKRGQPRSGFKQSTVRTKSFAPGGVGAGKMESLRGRAKFSSER